MLKKVKFLNRERAMLEDAVIQTAELVTVTEASGPGPFVLLKFRNGDQMTVGGEPVDFLEESAAGPTELLARTLQDPEVVEQVRKVLNWSGRAGLSPESCLQEVESLVELLAAKGCNVEQYT